ncbi:MAG: inorganic diphosphatase [Candidatus Jorgensenbacteria bacterium]|nr:inorganic diphosphatase [Candidatus Jorgensenbacteria bacterium]
MHNLYRTLSAFTDKKNETINVVIDIPKGSSNKYEYDEERGYFKLDRVLYHHMFYPFDYGFIPQTHYDDSDAVDVVLLTTYPTFPGCVIKARVIGGIDTRDEKGSDLKVIAVPITKIDPRFSHIESYKDLNEHQQQELLIHFKEIKKLEKEKYDKVVINGFVSRIAALSGIKKAVRAYNEKHS